MSRKVQVQWTTIFLIFFRNCTSHRGHVRSKLNLPMDTSVPAQDIFLCCQDCLARTESERAKRSPPARLFFKKGNAVDIFGNKCVIVCFQRTVHSAPGLLLLTKGFGLSQTLGRAVWSRAQTSRRIYSKPCED